jgi:predicted nucleic acid-binding protein
MSGITYDTGALIAAESGDRAIWYFHRQLLARGRRPQVPTVVVAQAWRGGPQPRLSRLLAGCSVLPFDEPSARRVGTALARSGTADIVDAAVVVAAMARNHAVVTSDPSDLQRIAGSLRRSLTLHVV